MHILRDLSKSILHWLESNGWWAAGASLIFLILSLIVINYLLVRMPADYFLRHRPSFDGQRKPWLSTLLFLGRNLAGFILFILGLIMSLPGVVGQGILTILIALTIMDFPGKRKLELKIIRQKLVRSSINSIRARSGKEPLVLPEETGG